MKKQDDIFTPKAKKRIEAVAGKLARDFRLDPLRHAEVKANVALYLWRNARYYKPHLSEWDTFAGLVVTSGAQRERARLAEEARLAKMHVPVLAEPDGDDGLSLPDPHGDADGLAFALDLADVLTRMPTLTAAILHAVVIRGLTFKEAAVRFGYGPRAFYRHVWPRVRRDFLLAGGEFFRAGGQ